MVVEIPVVKNESGDLESIPVVIDKDFVAAKLESSVEAEYLFILTAVDRVPINWNKPNQESLTGMSVENAIIRYWKEGHFTPGSMLPKVEAAIQFVKGNKNRKAIIASLENASLAISGESGTIIYN